MRIALLGDIGLFGQYSVAEDADASQRFDAVAEYLRDFDLVVGNLEVPFVSDAPTVGQKSAYLQSDPRNVELLRRLGVHAVTLANNHAMDFGRRGIEQTMHALDKANIDHFGVDDRSMAVDTAGGRVRLRGYCSFTANPLGVQRASGRPGINRFVLPEVEALLEADRSAGFLPILSVHSGEEHVNYPNPVDIRVARRLADAGPLVYYGHHPHVVQGIETRGHALLAYSLGNFCFDDVYTPRSSEPLVRQSENNKLGLILELEVKDAELVGHRHMPVFGGPKGLELHCNDETATIVAERSAALQMPLDELSALRDRELKAYRDARRKRRDLQWYLRRLNWNSVGILVRARLNRQAHHHTVVRHLHG